MVETMDPTTKEPKAESKFITRVSRATVETSMEDVIYNAFVYYHGLRSDIFPVFYMTRVFGPYHLLIIHP
jgi:hypothetical protein